MWPNANYMTEKRALKSESMITGPSTQNQRFERRWRDVFDRVLYYKFFTFMEGIRVNR